MAAATHRFPPRQHNPASPLLSGHGNFGGFPSDSGFKNPPAMQETQVQSLGWEDPLEKESRTTHSSILAGRIPWIEEPGRLQSMELQKESDMT